MPARALLAAALPLATLHLAGTLHAGQAATPPAPTQTSAQTPAQTSVPPAAVAAAGPNAGAADSGDLALPGDRWVVKLQPRVWYLAPTADIRLPGSESTVDLDDLDANQPRIGPYGELTIQADAWQFTLSGADFSASSSTLARRGLTLGDLTIAPGARVDTSLDLTFGQFSAGYRLVNHRFDPEAANVGRLWVLGGVRVYEFQTEVSTGALIDQAEEFWAEPFAGVRGELQLVDDFSIDLEITGGYSGDASSLDVAVGFQWRPVDWFGAQIGYRILRAGLEDGDGTDRYEFDGSLAGLFAGVVLRF